MRNGNGTWCSTHMFLHRAGKGGGRGGATDSHQVAVGAAALSGGSQLRQGGGLVSVEWGPLCCSLKPLS